MIDSRARPRKSPALRVKQKPLQVIPPPENSAGAFFIFRLACHPSFPNKDFIHLKTEFSERGKSKLTAEILPPREKACATPLHPLAIRATEKKIGEGLVRQK